MGVTNNLSRRLDEHRRGNAGAYSSRYRTSKLVYFEETTDVRSAIEREKQIKAWSRRKKLALIRSTNPRFEELCPPGAGRAPASLR